MKYLIPFLILLSGCSVIKNQPVPERTIKASEYEYLQSLQLEQKVYMEGCLENPYQTFHNCQRNMMRDLRTTIAVQGGRR